MILIDPISDVSRLDRDLDAEDQSRMRFRRQGAEISGAAHKVRLTDSLSRLLKP